MSVDVLMPKMGESITEGTILEWYKKVGDQVKEGDILAEFETDKATMEFESFYSGTLLHIGIKEGESSPVESTLAIIGDKNIDVSEFINKTTNKEDSDQNKNINNEEVIDEKSDETNNKENYCTRNYLAFNFYLYPLIYLNRSKASLILVFLLLSL